MERRNPSTPHLRLCVTAASNTPSAQELSREMVAVALQPVRTAGQEVRQCWESTLSPWYRLVCRRDLFCEGGAAQTVSGSHEEAINRTLMQLPKKPGKTSLLTLSMHPICRAEALPHMRGALTRQASTRSRSDIHVGAGLQPCKLSGRSTRTGGG
jgi:hypothetical protein